MVRAWDMSMDTGREKSALSLRLLGWGEGRCDRVSGGHLPCHVERVFEE